MLNAYSTVSLISALLLRSQHFLLNQVWLFSDIIIDDADFWFSFSGPVTSVPPMCVMSFHLLLSYSDCLPVPRPTTTHKRINILPDSKGLLMHQNILYFQSFAYIVLITSRSDRIRLFKNIYLSLQIHLARFHFESEKKRRFLKGGAHYFSSLSICFPLSRIIE